MTSYSYSNQLYEDNTLAPKYRPRYTTEEATAVIYPSKTKSRLSCFCRWCCCCFSYRCFFSLFFGTRRRIFSVLFFFLIIYVYVNTWVLDTTFLSPSLRNYVKKNSYNLASKQSYGFFDDIYQSQWLLLRQRVQSYRQKQQLSDIPDPSQFSSASLFYQYVWQPEFTCPHEERVGGKWICNPRSIVPASVDRQKQGGNGCLVYFSSGNNQSYINFQKAFNDIIGICEIHFFNPNGIQDGQNFEKSEKFTDNVHIHPWGFASEEVVKQNNDSNSENSYQFKSIPETISFLNHKGNTIDLFILDCEGCEFDTYIDWFDHDSIFMQILVEIHAAPEKTNSFFQTIQKEGYVIFHKGVNTEGSGNEQEYGFLKLTPDFFLPI